MYGKDPGDVCGEDLTKKEIEELAQVYGEKKEEFLKLADVNTDEDAQALARGDAFNRFLGDSRGFCELRSGMGKKVYYYIFDHDIPGDDAGSFHGSDLWFMFDSLGNSWRPFEGKHYDLARQVCSYWANFVKTGDPNGCDYNGNPLPEWRPYQNKEKSVMRFLGIQTSSYNSLIPTVIFHNAESPLCLDRPVHPQQSPIYAFQVINNLLMHCA